MNGPPTIAVAQKRDPTATITRAQKQVDALMDDYLTANGRGYRILSPRIDFAKRAGRLVDAFVNIVVEEEEEEDGEEGVDD